MADIAAADVTYTILNQRRMGDSRVNNRVRLAFGNGSDTYPADGIPITKGNLGCPTVVESMVVVDQGTSGYKFQYDQSAEKLVIMQAPAQTHGHNLLIIGGAASAGSDAVSVKTATLGREAATNGTIAKASVASLGGVVSETLAAAALSEASAVAIAAQTIEVEVIGW